MDTKDDDPTHPNRPVQYAACVSIEILIVLLLPQKLQAPWKQQKKDCEKRKLH